MRKIFLILIFLPQICFSSSYLFSYKLDTYFSQNKNIEFWQSLNSSINYSYSDAFDFYLMMSVFSTGDYNHLSPLRNNPSYYLYRSFNTLDNANLNLIQLEKLGMSWSHELFQLNFGIFPFNFGMGLSFNDSDENEFKNFKESLNHMQLSLDFDVDQFKIKLGLTSPYNEFVMDYFLISEYVSDKSSYGFLYKSQSKRSYFKSHLPGAESDEFSFFDEAENEFKYPSVFNSRYINFYGKYALKNLRFMCEGSSYKTENFLNNDKKAHIESFGLSCDLSYFYKKLQAGFNLSYASHDDDLTQSIIETFSFNSNYPISFMISEFFPSSLKEGLDPMTYYYSMYFLKAYLKFKATNKLEADLAFIYLKSLMTDKRPLELDFSLKYKVHSFLSLKLYLAQMFMGEKNHFSSKLSFLFQF